MLVRYLAGSCAARIASEGVAIALVLLVRATGKGPGIEGLFVAAWSGPSLLSGVLIGHGLDRTAHPRRFLSRAGLIAAVALGLDAALLGRIPTALLIAVTAAGGAMIPLFTGGMSSVLPTLVDGAAVVGAQALDSATYSVAGIAGPALVAALATVWSPRIALGIPALAVVGGAVILPLPRHRSRSCEVSKRPSISSTLAALGYTRELMAATVASTLAAYGWGGLEIGAVAIAALTGGAHLAGFDLAALAAAALCGALFLARHPLRHPDRAIPWSLIVMTGGGLLIALAGSPALVAAGFVGFGLGDGVLLVAVLQVRSRDAPPTLTAAVFTTAASLKTTASAVGAASAGVALSWFGGRGLFFALAATQLLAAASGTGAQVLRNARNAAPAPTP